MKLSFLKEYRCNCGKLLFKGFLLISVIEIKCRRCQTMHIFRDSEKRAPISFTITVNPHGNIIDTCRAISLSGMPRQYFIGKHVEEIFSLINGSKFVKQIQSVTSVLSDKIEAHPETYTIPYYKNKVLNGYHVFGKIKIVFPDSFQEKINT